jgi:2-polyprenyl-3-methyl-5-hydroxy-6-metoxy-1,4-benzoquinol methylase
MLADQVRMEAYKEAIHEVVKKGDVVADIGTGSGILAFLSAKAGAKKVYAIEQNEIIEEAQKLAKTNGLEDRIVFIKGRSDKVELPEKVDVITSELIGFFGIEENLHRFKIDARKRFLKPEGKLIPSWLELYLVPIESEAIRREYVGLWSNNFYGCDFSPVRNFAVSQRYVTDSSGKIKQLAPPAMIFRIDFYKADQIPSVFQSEFAINKAGVFHGFLGYFRASLSRSVILSTSPENPQTHWQQTFFPLQGDDEVKEGDGVKCRLIAIPIEGNLFWQWETKVSRNGNELVKYSQSNFNIKKEEIVIRKKDFKPALTETGEVYRRIFDLCDGNRDMNEIVEMISAEYPEKYRGAREAFEAVVNALHGMVKII